MRCNSDEKYRISSFLSGVEMFYSSWNLRVKVMQYSFPGTGHQEGFGLWLHRKNPTQSAALLRYIIKYPLILRILLRADLLEI